MSNVDEYNCEICNQTFSSENSKDAHMNTQKHLTNLKFNELNSISENINQKLDKLYEDNTKIIQKIDELKTFEENKHKILQDYLLKSTKLSDQKEVKSVKETVGKKVGFIIVGIPLFISIGYYIVKNFTKSSFL